jgi:hypothetical protein
MRLPSHHRFVEKAAAAMISAVEIYNKPAFPYREETFSILALNAWELLLKAEVVRTHNNDLRAIRVYAPKKLKSGQPSKKLYLRRNRAGNYLTIGIGGCLATLQQQKGGVPAAVKGNLEALTEIRDNSVHYVTASSVLAGQVHEIASACVTNFVILCKRWFARDLSSSLNLILPLSFMGGGVGEATVVSPDEHRIIKRLNALVTAGMKEPGEFAVALRLSLKLERSSSIDAAKVQISKDPDAIKVTLSEEDIRESYPWDYDELCSRLRKRYSDFLANNRFHKIRKPLQQNNKYCKARLLDPANPNGTKKDFYSPNILAEFDGHYTKKA